MFFLILFINCYFLIKVSYKLHPYLFAIEDNIDMVNDTFEENSAVNKIFVEDEFEGTDNSNFEDNYGQIFAESFLNIITALDIFQLYFFTKIGTKDEVVICRESVLDIQIEHSRSFHHLTGSLYRNSKITKMKDCNINFDYILARQNQNDFSTVKTALDIYLKIAEYYQILRDDFSKNDINIELYKYIDKIIFNINYIIDIISSIDFILNKPKRTSQILKQFNYFIKDPYNTCDLK